MAFAVIARSWDLPSLKKIRREISFLVAPTTTAPYKPLLTVITRNHFITRIGGRKKALQLGLVLLTKRNPNVLLYRKLQWYEQSFPVFKPWKRQVKALGWKVAPVIPIGTTGTGMNLQHYLGLALLQLGGQVGY